MDKNTVVGKLQETRQDLEHWYKIEDVRDRGAILPMITAIDNAMMLIEEQDITIRAMLGEFGDSCDASCGGD